MISGDTYGLILTDRSARYNIIVIINLLSIIISIISFNIIIIIFISLN